MNDKVLERLTLENRIQLLKTIRTQAKSNNLNISNTRGQYILTHDARMKIIIDIDTEIEWINDKLEELTKLNQDHIKELYRV